MSESQARPPDPIKIRPPRGLSQPVQLSGRAALAAGVKGRHVDVVTGQDALPENKIIGVVCSGDLSLYRDQVKSALGRGKTERPDAVWVCLEPKSDRITHDLLLSLDIEPVVLPLIDSWRSRDEEHGYDFRRLWRDNELLQLCDELIVFHKRTGNSPWRERASTRIYEGKLFVIEVGSKAKPSKGLRKAPVSLQGVA